ncbi:von Willebrand factor type A domain protein [Caulifigura coniformis]|uniref:von Willebrand factor type A domain protein n=1 Tax=Caulifigura coniformis TaxID=2527983 RepID=A0A517SKA0_9PLAN|nr:VWA domain-containing protein [Caulifigura coniformis]QDT56553.1 von Willebrand factor type A domain protein [Caulifigura coniformis]
MLTLAAPWWLILIPLPLILARLLPGFRPAQSGVTVPFFDLVARLTGLTPTTGPAVDHPPLIQQCVLWMCWILTTLALARPQWLEPPITRTVPTRDLLLAVDLSGSMETKDFTNEKGEKVDRLTAVKGVLDDFLQHRKGDRVGLILFGSIAFVQTPFTQDAEACRTLLDEAQVRMAGPKTALGDAIGLAITVFEHDSKVEDRVLIALTDGNDTGSEVPPDRAAHIAKDQKITIHTVAVGDPRAAGEEKLDEQSLRDIATTTGGLYSHAADRNSLKQIYARLDAIRARPVETVSHRPRRELFYWPLAAAMLVTLAYHILLAWRSATPVGSASAAARAAAVLVVGALSFGALGNFHFLRPWALLLLVPVAAVLVVIARQTQSLRGWRSLIDPELLAALQVGRNEIRLWRPLTALAVVSAVASVAIAGPTWRREASPFSDDESVLVICLKTTPSMLAKDVQPTRLTRASQKIGDLLALRPGTRTALIAYAGSAHVVLPLTRDAPLITQFASDLTPAVMPKEGDRLDEALTLAQEQIVRSDAPGSIVVIADDIPESLSPALRKFRDDGGVPVQVLGMAGEPGAPVPPDSPPAPPLNIANLRQRAGDLGGSVVTVTPDDSDVHSLASGTVSRLVETSAAQTGQSWHDSGYPLVFVVALLMLSWFRPGWFIRWPGGASA